MQPGEIIFGRALNISRKVAGEAIAAVFGDLANRWQ
jgi:hypothetical protein